MQHGELVIKIQSRQRVLLINARARWRISCSLLAQWRLHHASVAGTTGQGITNRRDMRAPPSTINSGLTCSSGAGGFSPVPLERKVMQRR